MKKLLLLLLPLLLFLLLRGRDAERPRVATFNIRNWPESPQQEEKAFAAIKDLGVPVVAVQEITEPLLFQAAAQKHLGPSWFFAATSQDDALHQVGVLFDHDAVDVVSVRQHQGLVNYRGARPALEVTFRDRDGDEWHLIVVHLKARSEEKDVRLRRAQLASLVPIVKAARAEGEDVVVTGDFNAGTRGDKETLAAFADETGLAWTSRDIGCTIWGQRKDGCVSAALDHAFASFSADVDARGPCAEGCAARDRCPTWVGEVSDHCPVVITPR